MPQILFFSGWNNWQQTQHSHDHTKSFIAFATAAEPVHAD